MATMDPLMEVIEDLIRKAFLDGYNSGTQWGNDSGRDADALTPEQRYADWRGWGPGATLPGGPDFRADVEAKERERRVLVQEFVNADGLPCSVFCRNAGTSIGVCALIHTLQCW